MSKKQTRVVTIGDVAIALDDMSRALNVISSKIANTPLGDLPNLDDDDTKCIDVILSELPKVKTIFYKK